MTEQKFGFEWNAVTIKALRKQMDLTQQEMSELLGTDQQTLREWETGKSKPRGASRVQFSIVANWAGFLYGIGVEETPLDVLELPSRAYNCLQRTGYQTVEQIATLTDEELLAIANLGLASLADIKEMLRSYLPRYPLPAKQTEPKHQVVGEGKPLEDLRLSTRAQNCLLRAGYKTVGQIAVLTDEELLAIRNLGWKSLAETKEKLAAYLHEHPWTVDPVESAEEPKPCPLLLEEQKLLAPPPLAAPGVLETVRKRNIPLNEISVERLELTNPARQMLRRAGIETIGALAWQSYDEWRENTTVRERLDRYLTWLVEQDETTWTEEAAGQGISLFHRLALAETTLEQLTKNWISDLTPRQQQIIQWRYGLYGELLTLKEISEQHLGITRERVRQIQAKAKNRLSHYTRRQRIRPFVALLKHLLRDAGGLMSEAQLETALHWELVIGDVNSLGVVRLIGSLYDDFKWSRNRRTWSLYPLSLVDYVQEGLLGVLEKKYVPLSVNDVIGGFKASHFYRSRKDELNDDFIAACLQVHPGILIDEDSLCSLEKWERRRTDEIVLALREVSEPAHYSDIAEKTNELLDPEMRTSAHNIHAILGRRTDLFVRVGHGIYGLTAWGLPDDGSVANAAYRVLREAGKPLHIDTITDGVLETWQVRRISVYMAVKNDPRFLHIGPGMYALRDRLSGQAEHETAADFGDLFGERLARWQAELDKQQSSADLDTHAEVDTIRDIGLDFFSG